jgi:hypothetical protein
MLKAWVLTNPARLQKFTLARSLETIFKSIKLFLGTKASNMIAGGSLTFIGHWKFREIGANSKI